MRRELFSPWVWLPPLVGVVLLALLIISGSNESLFLQLNRAGHALGEQFWVNLTMLGDGAVALALVLPCINRSPRCFWAALIAAVLSALWVQGIKHVIDVPRPLTVLGPDQFFHTGPGYRRVSFPSGHAAAIFAITGIWVMSLARHVVLRLSLLVLAILVSLSRVMVGVHWPLDLLGGMLGGWLAAWLGLVAWARWGWRTSGVSGFLAGLVLLLVAAALLFSKHVGYPDALPLQRALGLVCLVWGAYEMFLMLPRNSLRRDPKGD